MSRTQGLVLQASASGGVVVAEELAVADVAAHHGQAAMAGLVHDRPIGDATCGSRRGYRPWAVGNDATRTFATPRSVKALIAPNPPVLADDVGAKLLLAGLNLEEADLPTGSTSFRPERQGWPAYPRALVKATAIAWLFTGLRL
jgi:hypothetical protein